MGARSASRRSLRVFFPILRFPVVQPMPSARLPPKFDCGVPGLSGYRAARPSVVRQGELEESTRSTHHEPGSSRFPGGRSPLLATV
ncbi:hypothetical protein ACOMHN_021143 [Nucella lapillus]